MSSQIKYTFQSAVPRFAYCYSIVARSSDLGLSDRNEPGDGCLAGSDKMTALHAAASADAMTFLF
jgi:hypothetical protein